MKRTLLSIVVLLSLLTSCVDEELVRKGTGETTQLSLTISTVDEKIIETRAASDRGNVINKVSILLFDDQGLFRELAEVSVVDGKYLGEIKTTKKDGKMYVLANVFQELAGDWTGKSIDDIKAQLKIDLPRTNGYITADPTFVPMISEEIPFIGKQEYQVDLSRAMGRVIVKDVSGNKKFKLVGANIGNVPAYTPFAILSTPSLPGKRYPATGTFPILARSG